MIGYCPQVDPLLDLMNGYETLHFFGRIRGSGSSSSSSFLPYPLTVEGMSVEHLSERVPELLKQVGLGPFAHKPCGTYSGGNKRKLSLAVALIGDPAVLFLDEPSTGGSPPLPPPPHRIILIISASTRPRGRNGSGGAEEHVEHHRECVRVTQCGAGLSLDGRYDALPHSTKGEKRGSVPSHLSLLSLLEVEALCTRMCVMVSGRLQCIGSVQHLKGRFGGGYQVEVRTVPEKRDDCMALCRSVLHGAEVEEVHGGYFRMKVARGGDVELAGVFQAFEANKERLQIFDYSVSQCTLEQIFLQFAKEQEEERGAVSGMISSTTPDVVVREEEH